MILYLHFSCLSWDEYFNTGTKEPTTQNQEFSFEDEVLKPENGDSYVFNCYFHDMKSPESGGAIYYSLSQSNILVEKCSFLNCSTLQYTGAVKVSRGNSIIATSCGYSCYAGQRDGFCSISDEQERTINSLYDSSVSYCKANTMYIVVHQFGKIDIKSVNISYNDAGSSSTLYCEPKQTDTTTNCICFTSFCSFYNNTATNEYCLYFTSSATAKKHEMKMSNVIENHIPKTIFSNGEATICYCSILHNDDPCFYTLNENSNIQIKVCHIDNSNHTGLGSFFVSEKQNSFILLLPFFETGKCVNAIDFCKCTKNYIFQQLLIRKSLLFLLFSISRN